MRKWCVNIYPETRNGLTEKYRLFKLKLFLNNLKDYTDLHICHLRISLKMIPIIPVKWNLWEAIAVDWVLHTGSQQNKLHQMELLMWKLHVREPKLSCYPTFPKSGECDQPTPERTSQCPRHGKESSSAWTPHKKTTWCHTDHAVVYHAASCVLLNLSSRNWP